MALQIWLPLNGNLNNQGLKNVAVTNNGMTIDNNGKIGKCYYSNSKTITFPSYETTRSICFWVKAQKPSSTTVCFVDYKSKLGFGFNASGYIIVSCRTDIKMYDATNFIDNEWNHIAVIRNEGMTEVELYINGVLQTSRQAKNYFVNNVDGCYFGARSTGNPLDCYLNDIRIYDHCLSQEEVKKISQGLVLHLPLNNKSFYMSSIGQNLFKGSGFTQTDYNNMTVNSGSTADWSKYIRWYNGSKSIHTFTDGIDTILLNTTGNLGICFVKKATDIGLDSNSYYTISCEAKCTKSNAQLGIGISYYTTGSSWVWRGGTNKVTFNAINTWQTFTLTFKPDSDTQYICYCFTCADGVSGGTDTFSIRHCKLEKGSTPTQWIVSPEEESYGLLDTTKLSTCYDCSGYNYNGTIIGDLSIVTNSPIYADYINLGTISSHICIPNLNVIGFTDSYSIAWWGNVSSYSGKMMWGFGDGCRLNGIYNGTLWNTGDGSSNPLYSPGTTTQVSAPTTNVWHHFVMVGNGTKCLVYKDGILWAEAKTYKSLTGTIIYINGWLNTSSYTLANTKLVDFRIYATALSADDIKELYNNSMIVNGASIVPRDLE